MQLFMAIMALCLVVLMCLFFIGVVLQLLGVMLSAPVWVYIVIAIGFVLFPKIKK